MPWKYAASRLLKADSGWSSSNSLWTLGSTCFVGGEGAADGLQNPAVSRRFSRDGENRGCGPGQPGREPRDWEIGSRCSLPQPALMTRFNDSPCFAFFHRSHAEARLGLFWLGVEASWKNDS